VSQRILLVLSGGGAKAAAHLGVVRELSRAGLTPSRYLGTSMGAVIATGLAAGLTPDEVARGLMGVKQRDVFAVDRTALLMGVWARALLKPERLRHTLEQLLPVSRFSELKLPLTITATDLDSGDELRFGDGGEDVPLLDALCASCALPMFFPPFLLNGRRCADGGLREVVPLSVASGFAADLVVAVDVGPGFDMEPNQSGPQPPALLRLAGDAQRVLMASNSAMTKAIWNLTGGNAPLLWIRPRVRLGETFATDQLEWYIGEGERATRLALETMRS
jgi:NTE family protein